VPQSTLPWKEATARSCSFQVCRNILICTFYPKKEG